MIVLALDYVSDDLTRQALTFH